MRHHRSNKGANVKARGTSIISSPDGHAVSFKVSRYSERCCFAKRTIHFKLRFLAPLQYVHAERVSRHSEQQSRPHNAIRDKDGDGHGKACACSLPISRFHDTVVEVTEQNAMRMPRKDKSSHSSAH